VQQPLHDLLQQAKNKGSAPSLRPFEHGEKRKKRINLAAAHFAKKKKKNTEACSIRGVVKIQRLAPLEESSHHNSAPI
jgi:hypothetical protein